jgi:hypothetical protein
MDRIEMTRRSLERAVKEAGKHLSGDGRVSEEVAGELLGFAPGSLKNKRSEGKAPHHFQLGGPGHKVTYSLYDLAVWIEKHRITF